jgi:endonuclease G
MVGRRFLAGRRRRTAEPKAALREEAAMVQENSERLKKYLDMISRKEGGIEGVMHKLAARRQPREESVEGIRPGRSKARGKSATAALESAARGKAISPEDHAQLEAIIFEDIRPAIDVVDGAFTVTHPLWTQLSTDAKIRKRIEAAIPLVGRIELPGNTRIPYGGTGFVVGPDLVMTNRHVAELFAEGLGDRRLSFKTGATAGIDLKREHDRPVGMVLSVRKVVMIHPYWDMALLAVDGLPAGKPLTLGLADARDLSGRDIFIVGYPAFDPRNPASVQNDVFEGRYGVKKLQPGQLQGGIDTSSFGKLVPAATHDVSTLGGNSGSAMFDLETGEVLGLHFGGRYHERNYAVPAAALSRDDRVIAAGVNFAGKPPGGQTEWSAWWLRADAAEAIGGVGAPATPGAGSAATVASPASTSSISIQAGNVVIDVPLRITISLGAAAPAVVAAGEAITEALREPDHDTDYSTRKGYDPGFLNDPAQNLPPLSVPMPKPASARVLAKTRDGGTVLHYQNFSLSMHAQRRLALFTACNVTKTPELKRPEPGRDYTRRGLSGLGENDQERWFIDPRLDETLQLPDIFFTKDRKAFDKGHIVRRDDVAWGRTYGELKRANGDSYHVTNCSPQVGDFNRSADGKDNWGDLENHVLSEAANERLCVLAGPVLDADDTVFVGAAGNGVKLRAKIPERYWKVIVARVDEGLAAYGFVLEQDLADVDFEFQVPSEFLPALVPLSEIERIAGVRFDRRVRQADQFGSLRGEEIVLRQGVKRKTKVKT